MNQVMAKNRPPRSILSSSTVFSIFLLSDAYPTTTFVAFSQTVPILGPNSVMTMCMACRKNVQTRVYIDYSSPALAWFIGGILCILG